MYGVQSSGALVRAQRALFGKRETRIPQTVVLLGLCSLLTDISSEMVTTVLPLYLVAALGFTPLQYGIVDGIYQGGAAIMRLLAGYFGDRWRRHKEVAMAGYGLSAICKLALALIGSAFGAIGAVILADRTGKGIRTAPRDAMISLSTPKERLGASFGVHRAMDTAGAMIGPLLAFALLAFAPGAFHSLFLVSFCFAIAGFGVLALLVNDPSRRARGDAPPVAERVHLRAALGLLRRRGFRGLTLTASLLGLATASDGFIYLILQDRLALDSALFPLLATGTAVTFMLLAAPIGRIADHVGRGKVFIAGYAVLLAVYGLLLIPGAGLPGLLVILALLGAYYAATDGVLMALGSPHVPDHLRGSGLALLGTATSVARLLASVLFGALWTVFGIRPAIAVFGVVLVGAMIVAAAAVRRAEHDLAG